jgi:hypothetical protein
MDLIYKHVLSKTLGWQLKISQVGLNNVYNFVI